MPMESNSVMHKCEPLVASPVSFSKTDKWLLFAMTLIGATLRIVFLYDRPFTGDEVGTLVYIEKDITYLLSHFTTWLTMNYFLVAEKLIAGLFGKSQFSLGFISLAAGVGTIPLTALLAVRFTSTRVALSAAALVSMNPYLIQYSGIARSYSLLVSLSILLMVLFFKWCDIKSCTHGVIVAMMSFILTLAHPNGVYTVVYILFVVSVCFFKTSERRIYFNNIKSLLIPLTIAVICIFISYFKIFPEMLHDGLKWHEMPPSSLSYLPYAFSQYTSGGFYGWLTAALFISGILVSYKYEKPVLTLFPAIFLPILLISIQGLSHFPWGYTRFLIFVVPVIIIVIAVGADYYVLKYFSSRIALATTIIMALLVLSWIPRMVQVFDDKNSYPWHKVASFIKQNSSERDAIVGNDWVEPLHLRPYYPEKHYRIIPLSESLIRGEATNINSAQKTFFVSHSNSPTALAPSTFPESHFVKTTHPVYYFGKIQVIVYTRSLGHSILQEIRSDLIETVKGGEELAPEFATIYKNIWNIGNVLDPTDNKFCYYNLSAKCSELTERVKSAPRPFSIWQIRQGLKDCR